MAVVTIVAASGVATPAPAADGRRPSVLVILSDDQRADTIHALGNPHLRTPALDSLVARGAVCERAYCMGSMQGAVCVPSRAMMLSGRSLFHIDEQLRGCDTWPEAFGRAGYRTFLTGKWHNGAASATRCFAEGSSVFLGGMHDQFGVPVVSFTGHGDPVKAAPTPTHASELFGAAAERFVNGLGDEPFFAWVAFTAPHDPRQPPAGFRERLAGREPQPPANFLPQHPFDNGELKIRDEKLLGWPRTREAIASELADYYACIEGMDAQIGRIVAALAAKGRLDDTIILFTSDHGLAIGSHGLLGKQNLYEHSMRAPAILAGPGVPAGTRTAGLCYLHDLTATVGDLAGVAAPAQSEGRSVARALRGEQPSVRDELLLAYRDVQRALVTPTWKLIEYPTVRQTQCFDLARDPDERVNLAAEPAAAAHRAALQSRLLAARRAADDPLEATTVNAQAVDERTPDRPNVVVIFIDDLGYGDIGPFGATQQKTPHLDRMAAEGMKLTSFYAAPVCSVSRAQLLTGCYGVRVGVPGVYFPGSPEGLNPAEWTIAERLQPLGYTSACIGKWHLGDQPDFLPTRQGFDRYFGIPYSNDMQRVSVETGERVVPLLRGETVEELLTDAGQSTIVERSTAEAVRFIEESRDRPFFLYLPHTAVHAPLVPGRAFQGKSRNGKFGDWVEEVDASVGAVLDTLRRLKLAEKTLVIFTSDNGPWVGVVGEATTAGPLRGSKGSTWEGGVRVPTIAWWPGQIEAGTTCDTVAGTIDLLPTFVTLAGGTVAADPIIDGRDMSGLLLGTSQAPPRDAHYYFAGGSLQAVRQGRWKLAVAPQPHGIGKKSAARQEPASLDRPRLYDLDQDIGEQTCVAAAHPAVVGELRALAVAMKGQLEGPDAPARRPAGSVDQPETIFPSVPVPVKKRPQARRPAAETGRPPRPNIVLFLADDLGYGELGCYGNAAAVTPNLDRFAAEGLRLTDCHSASSVCSPSRSALLTGRHPYRNGVFTWIPEGSPIHLRTSEQALPKLLAAAGYDTCHVGKWHLNGLFNSPDQPQPDAHGYAWWLATQNNAAPSHAFPTNFVRNGTAIGRVDDYSAPTVAREAIDWLQTRRDPDKPFFLAVWTHEPHYPIASADRYEQLHAGVADPVERTYRANVSQLDDAFGMLMRTLADLGVEDETFVFFTSDNGPEGDGVKGPGRGLTGGLRERKRSMYEGGHRVPGIVRWPGRVRPGTESGVPMIGSDFFPTALKVAGVEPPAGRKLDGVNMLPAFVGGEDAAGLRERTVPMCWRWGGRIAYREGDWKIVVDESLENPELYDLAADRNETTDLAAREPDRLAAMMARLRASKAEMEAEGPDWWRTEPINGLKKKG